MKKNDVFKINRNLFNIFALFSREPIARYISKEIDFFSNTDYSVIGLILLDYTDNNYTCILLSRDVSMQYRAENLKIDIPNLKDAEKWIEENLNKSIIVQHENKSNFFDLFNEVVNEKQRHPYFDLLKNSTALSSAKETIKEVSYHYKDIDGNFIQQFQSLNGFDARLWEIYLFCLCREEFFSFKRNKNAPDFMIEKNNIEIAIEAVTIGRKKNTEINNINFIPKTLDEIKEELKNEMPLKFGSALYDKLKKEYWKKEHVIGIPLVIAIADFHDTMSMTWSFPALIDYIYGYRYEHYHNEKGELIIKPMKIDGFVKRTGSTVPAGFFFQPESENISAILFSSTATLSKFNRMGKQAGLGSNKSNILRIGTHHNFDKNASEPKMFQYQVNENCKELWSEGVSIFHNPNALIPLNPDLFPSVAHHFFKDENIESYFPDFFPYSSINQNIVTKE